MAEKVGTPYMVSVSVKSSGGQDVSCPYRLSVIYLEKFIIASYNTIAQNAGEMWTFWTAFWTIF